MLLSLFEPIIKKYFYNLLVEYKQLAKTKSDIEKIKTFLIRILNETLDKYCKDNDIK